MKYSHIEKERRYLLRNSAIHITPVRTLIIQDQYLPGSTIRLRRTEEVGKPVVYKLGQKIRVSENSPSKIAHTSIYITKEEFDLFASLPTRKIEKTRLLFPLGQSTLAVDIFEGEHSGLVLAEVDTGTSEFAHDLLPFKVVCEVTRDERFTGGALANTSFDALLHLLEEHEVS